MSLKRLWVCLVVAVAVWSLPVQAKDQSMDATVRLLALPLAECVSNPQAPGEHRFKVEFATGRWHARDETHSINVTIAGLSAAYTNFITPSWGINLRTDFSMLTGHNAQMDLDGYGVEGGVDAVFALGAKPSQAGPLNGGSLFFGAAGWVSKLKGDFFQTVPTDSVVVTTTTYQLHVGWQGRMWIKKMGEQAMYLEPAFYTYMNNAATRILVSKVGFDDDVNPTSFGAAANLHFGASNVFYADDRLAVGIAGAWGFDHNNSYQFNLAYSFGAFNPAAGE